ncbi:MAG: hypothetical protein NTW38_01570 [Candidatus Aminicenantes bacterium]|nr:hypothetical protein [Candidatus Aminicenantes bacterium]
MKKTIIMLLLVLMAVGFDWSLPQTSGDIVQITIKNQFSIPVDFYINGKFVCAAAAQSSCVGKVYSKSAPFKLEAWGYNNTKVIASKTLNTLTPGKNIIWSTGNVELGSIPAATSKRPVPPAIPAAAAQSAPKESTVSFVTSITALNYQGKKAQNRVRSVSLLKIERELFPTKAKYILSGQAGFRMGKSGPPVFYKASPLKVVRNLSNDHLSIEEKAGSLNPWINRVNQTLVGLSVKQITLGDWEESIVLSLGDAFPETIPVRFWARPLPKPNDRWTLIVADSGSISFRALDEKYRDSPITGRYRGVLVYAPAGNEFLQAAAAFTLRHGEDRYRIDQTQYASDAEGNQILPVLDVGSYLDFEREAPAIATQGPFPSWCVQSARFFNIFHMAVMTAAEGSTNEISLIGIDQNFLDFINRECSSIEKYLGKAAADELLGDYMKLIEFWHNKDVLGLAGATGELIKDVGKDIILEALPYGIGTMYKFVEFELGLGEAVAEQIGEEIASLEPFPPGNPQPEPSPEPPPVEIEEPEADSGGFDLLPELIGLGGLAAGAGTYLLLKDGEEDDDGFRIGVSHNGTDQVINFIINGTEYGPIDAGVGKVFYITKTGSCTTVNYYWKTSRGYNDSGTLKNKEGCGFIFDNVFYGYTYLGGISVNDCT